MKREHIFVGTHHKAGTVWMVSTFRLLAHDNGLSFVHLNKLDQSWKINPNKQKFFEGHRRKVEKRDDRPGVFFDYHSAFPDLSACRDERGAKGLHMIRDPRDMLASGVRYHLKSDEVWLHKPDKRWDGMTFAEKLASYSSYEDQLKFELDTAMGNSIRKMANFDDQGVFRNVRYEELILDRDMTMFHELLSWLGLEGLEVVRGLRAYWRKSLFGEKGKALGKNQTHVHSGAPEQWRSGLSDAALNMIEQRVGEEIVKLGYPLS
ncbi:MAG: sulfotransferase domain-containing protein [Phycisphaerales bacterium JB047]